MQADGLRLGAIEKVSLYGFFDVSPKLIPCISLRNYTFGKIFRRITTFGFFGDFENKLADSRTDHCLAR